ncbi:MAG TPA: hypothetical protein VHL98_16730 [Microvirga sp.]|nr:hypothetical protein [Microvirga sp.]
MTKLRRSFQEDFLALLDGLVESGVIGSYKADIDPSDPDKGFAVRVTASGLENAVQAALLRDQVRQALAELTDTVRIDIAWRPPRGRKPAGFPPENIQVGKCYLLRASRMSRVRRVVGIQDDGLVLFQSRRNVAPHPVWIPGSQHLISFAAGVDREIPPDWDLEDDQE